MVGPKQVGHYGMVIPRFVEQALSGKPLVVYDDRQQIRCFAHVREIVDCVIRLMESEAGVGSVFFLGLYTIRKQRADNPISVGDMVPTFEAIDDQGRTFSSNARIGSR